MRRRRPFGRAILCFAGITFIAAFARRIASAGAINAALFATTTLGNTEKKFRQAIHEYRRKQTQAVMEAGDPRA